MRAIGLMSGTSLDGVDVALIETDGEAIGTLGPSFCRPYGDGERLVLRQALVVSYRPAFQHRRASIEQCGPGRENCTAQPTARSGLAKETPQ